MASSPDLPRTAKAAMERRKQRFDYTSDNVYAKAFRRLEEKIIVMRILERHKERGNGRQ